MAANTAQKTYGTALTVGGVAVVDITSIATTASRESIDVSHLLSPNQVREFLPGVVDGGEVTLGVNYNPEDTGGQQDLWEAIMGAAGGAPTENDANTAYVITWPDIGGTSGETWTFNGHVTGFDTDGPDLASALAGTVTIKVAGQVTITTATA